MQEMAFQGVQKSKFSRGGMPPDPPRNLAPLALGHYASVRFFPGSAPEQMMFWLVFNFPLYSFERTQLKFVVRSIVNYESRSHLCPFLSLVYMRKFGNLCIWVTCVYEKITSHKKSNFAVCKISEINIWEVRIKI